MQRPSLLRTLCTFALIFSVTNAALAKAPSTERAVSAAQASGYSASLAAIEEKVEARRKALGIPGMSLAIVKDDQVIYAKGLGYKDLEKKLAATADTEFAIGSATKAFTALSVLMTADDGKVSLEASPKTVLPYFKMADPDTDKNMNIRDLMTHSSGLNRTDIAMLTGKLNREELIRVAGEAKPIAKLHEKFGYQNIMFAAAGEIVAVAQKEPWEKFVAQRIFKPLGMTNSNLTVREMDRSADHSFGYSYNFDTKETKLLPYREISEVAPAGAINSSANDMAKWIRFVLNGGRVNGKPLVSEKGYAEWLKPQMKVDPAGTVYYGLGWFIEKWNGLTVIQHGGNIDGFNSLVAMIPEKKLGFVMLTNVTASSLGGELMPIVWENILGKPGSTTAGQATVVAPEKEAGKYKFEAAGFDIDIRWADGKLTAHVPNQPVYTLENVGGRKYKLGGAPDGFFITFRDNQLLLEQPQGNYTLPKVVGDVPVSPRSAPEAKELIGKWASQSSGRTLDIKEADGNVTLNIDGQPPYTLTAREKDAFNLSPLPDSFWIKVNRGPDGQITGFMSMQPQGNVAFVRADASKIAMTVDQLYEKALAAAGGEANWRKLHSRVTTATVDLEQQGVKATATSWAKEPDLSATETRITALGKEIATGWEFFNGSTGEEAYSFAPAEKYTGKRLEDVKVGSDFHSMLDWKSKYKAITIIRIAKVDGEDAYAVEFEPENGTKFTEYYSTKTFLLLKREGVVTSSTSSVSIPYTIRFEDYRDIDGVKLPFKQINTSPSNGDVVSIVTSVKHNVAIDDKLFAPRKP